MLLILLSLYPYMIDLHGTRRHCTSRSVQRCPLRGCVNSQCPRTKNKRKTSGLDNSLPLSSTPRSSRAAERSMMSIGAAVSASSARAISWVCRAPAMTRASSLRPRADCSTMTAGVCVETHPQSAAAQSRPAPGFTSVGRMLQCPADPREIRFCRQTDLMLWPCAIGGT
jgi:hypothetical protein